MTVGAATVAVGSTGLGVFVGSGLDVAVGVANCSTTVGVEVGIDVAVATTVSVGVGSVSLQPITSTNPQIAATIPVRRMDRDIKRSPA